MSGTSGGVYVLDADLAEGAFEMPEMPIHNDETELIDQLELITPPNLTDELPDPSHPGALFPPAAETGVMPVIILDAEGSDDNEQQDAVRTTAEVQASAAKAG